MQTLGGKAEAERGAKRDKERSSHVARCLGHQVCVWTQSGKKDLLYRAGYKVAGKTSGVILHKWG